MRERAAPTPVRVAALVAASLVLGVAAHAGSTHGAPSIGALVVTAELVVLVVALLVGTGRWVARRLGRWSARVEDAAALLSLLLGQVLVHHLVGTAPAPGPVDPAVGHGHVGHAPGVVVDLAAPAVHAGGGMLAGHLTAALVAGVLLRRLEHLVLRLVAVLATCASAVRPRSLPQPSVVVVGAGSRPGLALVDAPLRLLALIAAGPVVRRGPPGVVA